MKRGEIKWGDLVWTDFEPSVGHEYMGKRPAIVIQSNQQLKKSNLVTVVPVTSNIDKATRDDLLISVSKENNLRSESVAKLHSITSFDYARFVGTLGKIDSKVMKKIGIYLKKHFDI